MSDKIDFLFRIMDEEGNILTKYEDGTVSLRIKTEAPRERRLGLIMGDTFYTTRENDHLHIKSNSFGFNYFLLKKSTFQYVMLSAYDKYYKIQKTEILTNGKILHFKKSADGNSFELQMFLSLDIIEKYNIKGKEQELF
jgi:hypothetical protein